MSRVLHAFAALGVALVTAQKFPARPIPQTLTERVDGALEELLAATAENPDFAAVEGGEGAQAFEDRLAKIETALFGDGDQEDGAIRRLDDLEEAFTEAEDANKLPEGAPTLDERFTALAVRLDAVEKAAPAAADAAEQPADTSQASDGKTKGKPAGGPADPKLV